MAWLLCLFAEVFISLFLALSSTLERELGSKEVGEKVHFLIVSVPWIRNPELMRRSAHRRCE